MFRELTVTYGNRLEVLGILLVEESTTYHHAYSMVKSMVRGYYSNLLTLLETKKSELQSKIDDNNNSRKLQEIDTEKEKIQFLIENYYILDTNRKRVTGNTAKVYEEK